MSVKQAKQTSRSCKGTQELKLLTTKEHKDFKKLAMLYRIEQVEPGDAPTTPTYIRRVNKDINTSRNHKMRTTTTKVVLKTVRGAQKPQNPLLCTRLGYICIQFNKVFWLNKGASAAYNQNKNLLTFIAETHFISDVSTGRDCD
jgi:hypothetical protein